MGSNRREGSGFQQCGPTIGERVWSERCGGGLGEPRGEFLGERDPGLGGLRGQLQCPDDAADAEGGGDVVQPQQGLALLLGEQRCLEFGGQLTSCLVPGDNRVLAGGDDGAQIREGQVGEIDLRGSRTIEPLGDAQLGEQLLGHLDETGCGDLFFAFGLESGVLLSDCGTYRWYPALKRPLGNSPLLLWQVCQNGIAVSPARLEPLGFRTLRKLRGSSEIGPWPAVASAVGAGRPIAVTGGAMVRVTSRTCADGPIAVTAGTTVAVGARPISARRARTTRPVRTGAA